MIKKHEPVNDEWYVEKPDKPQSPEECRINRLALTMRQNCNEWNDVTGGYHDVYDVLLHGIAKTLLERFILKT